MLDFFQISEVINSIKENKLRNMLTGFGIAWGIFILVLLLGAGEGLQKGVFKLFGSFAQKSIFVFGGITSADAKNTTEGKTILFNNALLKQIKNQFNNEITHISPEITFSSVKIQFEEQFNYYNVKAVSPDFFQIKTLGVTQGRSLNSKDDTKTLKNVVIGSKIAQVLFKDVPEDVIVGKKIDIDGLFFTVIGVLEEGTMLNQQEQNSLYIPVNTLQDYFNQGKEFKSFLMNLSPDVISTDFELDFKKYIGNKLDFDYRDTKALTIMNFEEQIKSFNQLFDGLKIFLWFIGVCLLLTGMIGVGNIMLVIVKERTREIGIRKAVGATPKSIIGLILTESILITLFSGLFGLMLGVLVICGGNIVLSNLKDSESNLIKEFSFNGLTSLSALLILISSGCLAGIIPAKKAAEIKPIDAIRQE